MKLDLVQAYQQLLVDDAMAEAQTIVTHRGALKCCHLQFSVRVAPGLFQSIMEWLLKAFLGYYPTSVMSCCPLQTKLSYSTN